MAFKDVTTRGPIEWAKITEETRDMSGYEDEYAECEGAYTLNQRLTQAAFEKLNPVYHRAASMNGYILPEDLQREVDAGYVTSERAQELARLRAQSEFQQTRSQQAQQQLNLPQRLDIGRILQRKGDEPAQRPAH